MPNDNQNFIKSNKQTLHCNNYTIIFVILYFLHFYFKNGTSMPSSGRKSEQYLFPFFDVRCPQMIDESHKVSRHFTRQKQDKNIV